MLTNWLRKLLGVKLVKDNTYLLDVEPFDCMACPMATQGDKDFPDCGFAEIVKDWESTVCPLESGSVVVLKPGV